MLLLLISLSITSTLYLRTDKFTRLEYSDYLYITTDEGGLLSFKPDGNAWKNITIVSGLFSNTTKDISVRNDTIWTLTPGGITLFNRELESINLLEFNPLFFNDTNPNTIVLDSARVILGGETGLQWFQVSDFDDLSRVDKMDYDLVVFDILPLDTCYILGTSGGIYKTYNFTNTDTVKIENLNNTYTFSVIGSSIWAGGSWGCKDITADSANFSLHTVWQIAEIDTSVYIATSGGLYKYENGEWRRLSSGDVRGVCKTNYYDSPAFIVRGEGIAIVDSIDFIRPPGLASNKVCDLTQTPDGTIFISHRDTRRITKFDGEEWEIINRNNEWGIQGGILYNIESNSKGRVYIGSWYWIEAPILYQWVPDKDSLAVPIVLPVNATTICGMMVDKRDDVWIGAFNRFTGDDWILKMHSVKGEEDSLEWVVYTDPSFRWVRVFAEGIDVIYGGNSPTSGGAGIHMIYRDGSVSNVTGGLGSSTLSMASDLKGDIWAGLENSLVYISGDEVIEVFNSSNSGLLSDNVDGITFDFQGGMWCYHSGDGLSYRNPEDNWFSYRGFSSVDADDITYPLHFTLDHHLFVGTYEGLYELNIDFNIPRDSLEYPGTNVYPNPFNVNEHDYLYFSSGEIDGKTVYIYDIYGKLKEEYRVTGDHLRIENVDLTSGLYFYIVKGEEGVLDKGRFVVVR
ncbi:T9SS type A sorting domain-containing protein [candidate division WOR-3 bacterium]|nr:T9SS type A sorting domain-containing protein [candidate division WOR-3 bacterium]